MKEAGQLFQRVIKIRTLQHTIEDTVPELIVEQTKEFSSHREVVINEDD
jgi:hypothetical protein